MPQTYYGTKSSTTWVALHGFGETKCKHVADSYHCKTSVSKERWGKLEGTFSLPAMPDRVVFSFEGPASGVDLLIESVVISCSNPSECDNVSRGVNAGDGDENIILNPKFEDGLNNWSGRGSATLSYIIQWQMGKSFQQQDERRAGMTFSKRLLKERRENLFMRLLLWFGCMVTTVTSSDVRATLWVELLDLQERYVCIANLQATDKDWVQLKGRFISNGSSKRVVIFLEGPPAGTDILVRENPSF